MIEKITIKNIASYREETSLETSKKINLIYGLNGSGKTTISDYLQSLNDIDIELNDCSIQGFNIEQQKILVYNQKFVEKNFHESDVQKGIFTLAEENRQALGAIQNAENEKIRLQEKIDETGNGLQEQLADKQKKIHDNLKSSQEKVWEIVTNDKKSGDNFFDKQGFFKGLNSKEKLFNHLAEIELVDTDRTIDDLKKDLQELSEDATERTELSPINTANLSSIETDAIFQEAIIGKENSAVSNLISKLNHSDWIKQGMQYFPTDGDETCPLCQQQTLTPDLKRQIEDYFDETYKEKINQLGRLKEAYKLGIAEADYTCDFFQENEKEIIQRLLLELKTTVRENAAKIDEKLRNPSQSVTLSRTEEKIGEINTFVRDRNNEIEAFNQKIQNRDESIDELKTEFWEIQRKQYDTTISHYQNSKRDLEEEKLAIGSQIREIKDQIKYQSETISENQKLVTNIEQTIEAVNQHLLSFGIQDFKIVKHA